MRSPTSECDACVVACYRPVHNRVVTEGWLGNSRYEIRRKIGEGGMGVVFEAFDREREMVVALKTLSRVSAASIYRLKQEFRSLAALRHPNLITLYDLAQIGDRWLFTMELVQGVELMSYVRPKDSRTSARTTVTTTGGVDWLEDDVTGEPDVDASASYDEERLRAVLVQLTACLRAIHDTGRVHRDLKPSNVLVRPTGDVVLLDFGLVATLAENGFASLQSSIVGTPAYMAPEQASNDTPTAAIDWYAVGVMLYEALTGVRPFGGSMVQLLTSKQSSEPAPPSELVRGLPEDLTALTVDLLRRTPADRPTGDAVLRRLTRAEPDDEECVPPSRRRALIGRDRELSVLRQALDRDGAHVLELRGAPGMGRTALLRTYLAELGGRAVVLAGRCREQEAVPFKAFDAAIDALSRHLRHLDQHQVRSLLPESVGALSRVFPVLDRVPAIAQSEEKLPTTPDVHTLRRRAFTALRELLHNVAREQRVIVAIDDVHWGDTDSAALLEELLRPPSPRLLIVLSYRSTEQQSPLVCAIHDHTFRERVGATWSALDLAPLAAADARSLATTLVGRDPDVVRHVASESHGNPLLVVELARHAASERAAAPTLESILDRRILALPLAGRALLEVLALAAAPIRLSVATRAVTSDCVPDARVVADASAQHLLRSSWYHGHASLDIFSDHVRRAVLRTLPPEGHRQTHLRLADALEQANAPPELCAHHREHAGETRAAALGMLTAGETAMRSLAFHRAVHFFERAGRLLAADAVERGLFEERLGEALAASGRSEDAARRFLAASKLSGTRRDALDLQRLAAEHLMRSGHIDEGLEVVKVVLNAVGLSLPASPRRALADVLLQRTRLRMRGLEASPVTELSEIERRRMDACWTVAVGLSMADTIVGADFHARHLLLALDSGDPSRVARALALEAAHVGSTGLDRHQRANELLDEVDALAHQLRDPHAYGLGKLMRGCTSLFTGDWRDAVAHTDEAAQVFREQCSDVAWEVASASRFNHVALFYLGEIAELGVRVTAAVADARSRGDRFAESCAGSGSAVVAWLASGQTESVRDFLAEEPRRWGKTRFALQHFLALQGLTLVDLYEGNHVAARDRLAKVWPRMKSSMILRVQLLNHTMVALRARTRLAAATEGADLDAVERDASKLAREGLTSSRGLALLIRAGVRRRHDPEAAVALYTEAAQVSSQACMMLHAAVARCRLGELIGGDEGRAHRDAAEAFMRSQHIVAPERFVAMLAP